MECPALDSGWIGFTEKLNFLIFILIKKKLARESGIEEVTFKNN
jgi:hypothetical protein